MTELPKHFVVAFELESLLTLMLRVKEPSIQQIHGWILELQGSQEKLDNLAKEKAK